MYRTVFRPWRASVFHADRGPDGRQQYQHGQDEPVAHSVGAFGCHCRCDPHAHTLRLVGPRRLLFPSTRSSRARKQRRRRWYIIITITIILLLLYRVGRPRTSGTRWLRTSVSAVYLCFENTARIHNGSKSLLRRIFFFSNFYYYCFVIFLRWYTASASAFRKHCSECFDIVYVPQIEYIDSQQLS